MISKVYFIPVSETDPLSAVQVKLRKLLEQSTVLDFIGAGQTAVLKIHFGEKDNAGYVKPQYVRIIAEKILQQNARPVLSDTNTLYRGMRTNSPDHLKIAAQHGFTKENTGADVIIPENTKEDSTDVVINQKFIKVAKVAGLYLQADALVDITHFKGHLMTGFGGALKNIGMGCATREGKLAQHSQVAPIVHEKNCVGCGACETVCPADAIKLIDGISRLDPKKCIGCASCIAACAYQAIDVNWEAGSGRIQERMIEYAKAVLDRQKGKTAFVNFALKITKECDCLAKDDPRISPDVGIFASCDPVAVDQACYDMVLKAGHRDVFKEVHPNRDGLDQLKYAAQLGLGSREYELVTV